MWKSLKSEFGFFYINSFITFFPKEFYEIEVKKMLSLNKSFLVIMRFSSFRWITTACPKWIFFQICTCGPENICYPSFISFDLFKNFWPRDRCGSETIIKIPRFESSIVKFNSRENFIRVICFDGYEFFKVIWGSKSEWKKFNRVGGCAYSSVKNSSPDKKIKNMDKNLKNKIRF